WPGRLFFIFNAREPMLDSTIKAQLQAYMERLVAPVELVAALGNDEGSREMKGLLDDIVSTSSRITLIERTTERDRVPSFAVNKGGEDTGICFAGLPMGHEFTSLVLALLQASGYPPKVDADLIEQIKALEGHYEFETYISL